MRTRTRNVEQLGAARRGAAAKTTSSRLHLEDVEVQWSGAYDAAARNRRTHEVSAAPRFAVWRQVRVSRRVPCAMRAVPCAMSSRTYSTQLECAFAHAGAGAEGDKTQLRQEKRRDGEQLASKGPRAMLQSASQSRGIDIDIDIDSTTRAQANFEKNITQRNAMQR